MKSVITSSLENSTYWCVAAISSIFVNAGLLLISGYQRFISPLLRPCCRFTPSCSSYAMACMKKYGFVKGLGKTLWRVARCHPFCQGGLDQP
jgi:uncharacterized protein